MREASPRAMAMWSSSPRLMQTMPSMSSMGRTLMGAESRCLFHMEREGHRESGSEAGSRSTDGRVE